MPPIKSSVEERKERTTAQGSPYAARSRKSLTNSGNKNEAKSARSIEILNDDCLTLIFGYLETQELIKIERVCKKWMDICLAIWSCRKSFGVRTDLHDCFDFTCYNLESILKRCGTALKKLDLGCMYTEINPFIPMINKYCNNLTHLDLTSVTFRENEFGFLADSIIKKLKCLCLDSYHVGGTDTGLSTLLKKAESLEEFVLCFDCGTGKTLLNLSTKCKKLKISVCDITNDMFKKILNRLPCLENLNLGATYVLPETLLPFSNQLVQLDLRGMRNFFNDDTCKTLRFSNLKTLSLMGNELIGDEHVSHFSRNCPLLERINLSRCKQVTDTGFRHLENFKNLVGFFVSETKITDTCLEYLAAKSGRYKLISVGQCENITEEGIIRVIGCLPDLHSLDFWKTTKLFEETFFKNVLETVLLRTNNIMLDIDIWSDQMGLNGNYGYNERVKMEMKRLGLTKCKNGPLEMKRLQITRWVEDPDTFAQCEPEYLFVA